MHQQRLHHVYLIIIMCHFYINFLHFSTSTIGRLVRSPGLSKLWCPLQLKHYRHFSWIQHLASSQSNTMCVWPPIIQATQHADKSLHFNLSDEYLLCSLTVILIKLIKSISTKHNSLSQCILSCWFIVSDANHANPQLKQHQMNIGLWWHRHY